MDLVAGAEVSGGVTLRGEASDDGSTIEEVEFQVDGDVVLVAVNAPFELTWDSTSVTDGNHTVKAIAKNALGETGQTSVSILVNNCDLDDDTYLSEACGGSDCDDLNPNRNPGALDTVGDGIDQNCDALDGVDLDQDGYASKTSGGSDCDDSKANVHPCADDLPGDGLDANCDTKDTVSCNDCIPCTGDIYLSNVCVHTPINEGEGCDDGDICTSGETCTGGQCNAGLVVTCNDSNPCTLDNCDPGSGCAYVANPLANGTLCATGVCLAGACCTPVCTGKVCGNDGCGGSCGECPADKQCDGSGQCTAANGLVWKAIPAGTFTMGCSPGDVYCDSDESPTHSVTLSAFDMLETEVTEAQYLAVMGTSPSCNYNGGGGPDNPVECVTWFNAKAFCEAVGGRLPTEAEWEYAARGGTTTKYYCGDLVSCLTGIAWYYDNSGSKKQPVKGKTANGYGLYDMLGNVWEWTADWYSGGYYAVSPASNPTGPISGSGRVARGGVFDYGVYYLRVSDRTGYYPSDAGNDLGLRCARSQ